MKYPKILEKAVKLTQKHNHGRQQKLLMPYDSVKGDSKLYLLKRDGRTKKFIILAVIENFIMGSDGFRNRTVFELATLETTYGINNDESFGEAAGKATHVAITPMNDVYSIRDGDEVTIEFQDFTYKIYGFLQSQEVFNLEENQ